MRSLPYVWISILFFPALYAGVTVAVAPYAFEELASRLRPLAFMIDLGRSRPWIQFDGLPYIFTLRFMGALTGFAAGALVLVILALMLRTVFGSKVPERNNAVAYKKMVIAQSVSAWLGQQALCLFALACCAYIVYASFLSGMPIMVQSATALAFHVLMATISPSGVVILICLLVFNWRTRFSSSQ